MSSILKQIFSRVDTAWLRMEQPYNLMMINACLMFDEPLEIDRLKATLEYRLLHFDRFRQRVMHRGTKPQWELDPYFDLNSHIHRVALPVPGGKAELEIMMSDLFSIPLDFSKPPWQAYLIENYGTGCCLLFRIHHCMGDGIALVKVFLNMIDKGPNAPWPTPLPSDEAKSEKSSLILNLVKPTFDTFVNRIKDTQEIVIQCKKYLQKPNALSNIFKTGNDVVSTLKDLVFMRADTKTVLKGHLGISKKAVFSDPISLDIVKKVGKLFDRRRSAGKTAEGTPETGPMPADSEKNDGEAVDRRRGDSLAFEGTINNVMLTAVAGAFRRYLIKKDQPVDKIKVSVFVPVNLRPMDEKVKMGNRFGLVIFELPVNLEDPWLRFAKINDDVRKKIRSSVEPVVSFAILSALGMIPDEIQALGVNFFSTKGTAVMTNVPGPREIQYFCGKPVSMMLAFVPQSGNMGIGIAIMSYAGEIYITILSDNRLVPYPREIIELFHEEFDHLRKITGIA